MVVGLYEDMIPIDFGFSRSKVKVTMFVYVKLVSAVYIWRTIYCRAFIFHLVIALYEDMIPIDFGFSRLKVKVTGFQLIFAFLTYTFCYL